jgi:hypothetical protein
VKQGAHFTLPDEQTERGLWANEPPVFCRSPEEHHMKLLLEILLSIILHPIAMILMWINLIRRADLARQKKVVWFIVSLVWGLGPILYMLVADGALW